MKFIKFIIIVFIIILFYLVSIESIKVEFWRNYQEITVKSLSLDVDEKEVLNDSSIKTKVGLWNYYYDENTNVITVYLNEILENKQYNLPTIINGKEVVYKKFIDVDEYKDLDNDVFYIDKDGQVNNFINELYKADLFVNYEYSKPNIFMYISTILILGLFTFYLFINVYDFNRRRKEIMIKKIFGVKLRLDFSLVKNILLLIFSLMVYLYVLKYMYTIPFKYYLITVLIVIIFQVIDILLEHKINKTADIVKYIKGERIKSVFSKIEYYLLLFFKLISFLSILLISILVYVIFSFATQYEQYSKVKDYYSFDGYLEISEMSQEEYLLRSDSEDIDKLYGYTQNGEKNFIKYVEDKYDAVYAYSQGEYEDYNSLNDSGDYLNNLIVCNNNYLTLNGDSDLIKSEDRDYLLMPSELKDKQETIKEQINSLEVGKDYDIYFYDEMNPLYNIEGDTLTYNTPILYVNNTYGNDMMYTYAYQSALFKGGKQTIINYYDDNGIEYDASEIISQSRYNQYTTIIYSLVKVITYLIAFIGLIIFILVFVIKEKVKIYFIENRTEYTIRKINGQKGIYRSIYMGYLFLDFLFLIPLIIYTVSICVYTSIVEIFYINLVMFLLIFVILDILIIVLNIRRVEKKNILNNVKGAI